VQGQKPRWGRAHGVSAIAGRGSSKEHRTWGKVQLNTPTADLLGCVCVRVSRPAGLNLGRRLKIGSHFDVSFSSTSLGFQRWEHQNTTKNVLQKNRGAGGNPKPFFSIYFITFLGVYRRGEFKNTTKKIGQKLTNPGTVLASEEPTNHVGVCRVFF
jgi:hypothetical protein